VTCPKKSEKVATGVSPHHHTIMGLRRRVRAGREEVWRRVEVIWGGGRVRGELAPFVFYFPQSLAFFGFSPHNFLIRAKMHK